jgi:hypothetical protein
MLGVFAYENYPKPVRFSSEVLTMNLRRFYDGNPVQNPGQSRRPKADLGKTRHSPYKIRGLTEQGLESGLANVFQKIFQRRHAKAIEPAAHGFPC